MPKTENAEVGCTNPILCFGPTFHSSNTGAFFSIGPHLHHSLALLFQITINIRVSNNDNGVWVGGVITTGLESSQPYGVKRPAGTTIMEHSRIY